MSFAATHITKAQSRVITLLALKPTAWYPTASKRIEEAGYCGNGLGWQSWQAAQKLSDKELLAFIKKEKA